MKVIDHVQLFNILSRCLSNSAPYYREMSSNHKEESHYSNDLHFQRKALSREEAKLRVFILCYEYTEICFE